MDLEEFERHRREVELRGGDLSYVDIGSGEPVVLTTTRRRSCQRMKAGSSMGLTNESQSRAPAISCSSSSPRSSTSS